MSPLYFPVTLLIRTVISNDNEPSVKVMEVENYIDHTSEYFKHNGFYAYKIARRTDILNKVAQVLSAYKVSHNQEDPLPFKRGVNFIQFFIMVIDGGL